MNQVVRPVEVLLVDGNPVDVLLTREALLAAKVINNMHVLENGDDAMAFLRRETPFANAVRPDLIVLDLNLPRKSGYEVMSELKSDPALQSIPVVVLSHSSAAEDVRKAHGGHANCFITKPPDLASLINVVRNIEQFWLCIVKLPDEASD